MNDFGRILTLLRKERGYTQKRAAEDLHVSQALLSHYEKGLRECGLDFVVTAAEYYGVSCDYLLGRTPLPNGSTVALQTTLPPITASLEYKRRLIANSISLIFAILESLDIDSISICMSEYLFSAVYKAFRILYTSNPKNVSDLFSLDPRLSGAKAEAHMAISEATCRYLLSEMAAKSQSAAKLPQLSPTSLFAQYPDFAPSIFELIRNIEKAMQKKI